MEGGTDDPVYLPSVWFLKHLVLTPLETEERGDGEGGRKHSSGKTAFSLLFILKSYSECVQIALVLKFLAFSPVDISELFCPHNM